MKIKGIVVIQLLFTGLILGIIYAPGLLSINWSLILEFTRVLLSWPPIALIVLITILFMFKVAFADLLGVVSERIQKLKHVRTPYGDMNFDENPDQTPAQPEPATLKAAPTGSPVINTPGTTDDALRIFLNRSAMYTLLAGFIAALSAEHKKGMTHESLSSVSAIKADVGYIWGVITALYATNFIFMTSESSGTIWTTTKLPPGASSDVFEKALMKRITVKYSTEYRAEIGPDKADAEIETYMTTIAAIKTHFLSTHTSDSPAKA